MRNIKLIVEYEGTNYSGWQAQTILPTIQGSLVTAARRLTRDNEARVAGASRTDAGFASLGLATSASLSLTMTIACQLI